MGTGDKKKRKRKIASKKRGSVASLPSVDLRVKLEEEMERSKKRINARFISLDFLVDLFKAGDPSELSLSLANDLDTIRKEGREWHVEGTIVERKEPEWQIKDVQPGELEEYVRTQACKLYAILLLVGQSQVIVPLHKHDHPVTDRVFDKGEIRGDVSYCSMQYLQAHEQLSKFANKFFDAQWLIPPVLRWDTDPIFPVASFRFPFVGESSRIGRGGYGQIFKVKVAHRHLKVKASDGYDKGSVVAHKEIEKRDMSDERLRREVSTIRARSHPNIVRFYASFCAGRAEPWSSTDQTKCLHMLFEHTNAGNMADWLKSESAPKSLDDVAVRRKHIMESIDNIVEAVTHIHKEIGGLIAFHHDLKPDNILRFEGPPATWKICDFGMANMKRADDDSGTTHRENNVFGSYIYQPPEYFNDGQGAKHGRPFDIWSLGSVLLELLTVWKYGWSEAGLQTFYRLRGENTELASPNRWIKSDSAQRDHSYHNNPNVVKDWICHLRQVGDEDVNFLQLLGLVSEMLVERTHRIFIWEVHMDIYEMMNPDIAISELRDHFHSVVQPSNTSLNDLSNVHNPLKRARERDKDWQESILKAKKWSVDKPEPTPQLTMKRRNTGMHLSTLATCQHTHEFEQNEFYGRHDTDAMIAEGFRNSNFVGLHGLSGIGKSHLAYHYIERFRNTKSIADRKHTFWVCAVTKLRLYQTLSKIAETISSVMPEPDKIRDFVRDWLSNEGNGPWIMVIDGLNSHTIAAYLSRFLPKDSGEVLITTKDRTILDSIDKVFAGERRRNLIRVEPLTIRESRLMFQWHNDDVVVVGSEMNHLLENAFCPALIKLIATWAARNNVPVSTLYGLMNVAREKGQPMRLPEAIYNELTRTYDIFQPLGDAGSTVPMTALREWPSHELTLLGELSCLDNDKMDFKLIRQNYRKEDRLWEMLGALENGSFIVKRGSIASHHYNMCRTIQELTHRWMLDNMGLVFLLKLHQTALCMLALQYAGERRTKPGAGRIRRSSYKWKQPFMSHFERYLAFATEYAGQLKGLDKSHFVCGDRMVFSVITFVRVYLDEGRYNDAVCVLELTRRFYRGAKYRMPLVRQLCEAYTLPPLSSKDETTWAETMKLLEEVVQDVTGPGGGDREQEWLCLIDLANLYSKFSQPAKASNVLARMHEVSLGMRHGKPYLCKRSKRVFEPQVGLKLAIHKCVAEARVHVAKAGCSKSASAGKKHLSKALDSLNHAKSAMSAWFSREDTWAIELEEDTADILCKMCDPNSTGKACAIYEHILTGLQTDFLASERQWSQTRTWDLKCKIANAQLQLGSQCPESIADRAFDTLQKALQFYEEAYGIRDEKHDEHTRACAYLLMEAYESFKRKAEAEEIIKRYSLQPGSYILPPEIVLDWEVDFPTRVVLLLGVFLLCAVVGYLRVA